MKINNVQQPQSYSPNYTGKLLLPETLSEAGKRFIDECGERVIRILDPAPHDMFLHEIDINNKSAKRVVLIYKEGEDPDLPKRLVLGDILSEFNRKLDLEDIRTFFNKIETDKTKIVIEKEEPNVTKPFVPRKIGKPQKPFIKNFYRKK